MNKKRIPWNKGKKWPKEVKDKISESMRGQKAHNLGVPNSIKTNEKIAKSMVKYHAYKK